MTNAELIAKIKAEIERRMKELDSDWIGTPAAGWAFSELLSFLSTLEEKPDKSLEEEIDKRYLQNRVVGYVDGVGEIILGREAFGRIARHFAKWGAEHTSSSSEKPNNPDGLDEAAEKYADYHPACFHKPMAESFKAGADCSDDDGLENWDTSGNGNGVRNFMDELIKIIVEKLGNPAYCDLKDHRDSEWSRSYYRNPYLRVLLFNVSFDDDWKDTLETVIEKLKKD